MSESPRKFKVGDAVQTRDGRKAEIVRDDLKSAQPLLVIITESDGAQWAEEFSVGGSFFIGDGEPDENDLIPAPRRHTVWVNLFNDLSVSAWTSRHKADAHGGSKRIGRTRVELEDGRFDE